MEPIDDEGAEPTPTRSTRSWVATAAVATGLAVGAAGLAGAATGGGGDSSSAAVPAGYGQVPSGQVPSGQAPSGQVPSGQAGQVPDGVAPGQGYGGPMAGGRDPSGMPNGPGETPLTGETATKVTEAALAEYPGATVIRVETDAGDAEYEAHLKKADGTMVTVLFDADFDVVGTEDGFGPGGPGGHDGPPPGAPRSTDDAEEGTTST